MKQTIFLLSLFTIVILTSCNNNSFTLDKTTQISFDQQELEPLAQLLAAHVKTLSGIALTPNPQATKNRAIILSIDPSLSEFDYQIEIGEYISLTAPTYSGLAMGVSQLVQDLVKKGHSLSIRKSSYQEKAKYDYRAVLIDVARFWHPVGALKETIDLLWFYRVPYMQLHLSDNRRFTLPLKDYPLLNRVNAAGEREYYTEDEIKELVEYARIRGISIIPEIDLPGHSTQMWSKYPEVFGSIDPESQKARNLYVVNIAKEACYEACEDIMQVLAELFYTSPYLHFGGDEVYLEVIKTLPEYKTFCVEKGLTEAAAGNVQELFCYFINRMHQFVKNTGKKTIIWEGFHGIGAGSIEIDTDIQVIVWNTTYNHPQTMLDGGFSIINSTWIPWYYVGAMNLATSNDRAFKWDIDEWEHWNEEIPKVKLGSKEGINGAQISFWEQNYYQVVPILSERLPVFSEILWKGNHPLSFEESELLYQEQRVRYENLFHPTVIEAKGLLSEQDQSFVQACDIVINSELAGVIKYDVHTTWGLPKSGEMLEYTEPLQLDESSIVSAQLFDQDGNAIGYPVQHYYQKLDPAYRYIVFGGAPVTGWEQMPDFDTLPVIREGIMGKMSPERLAIINGELFAKVKATGHIDTRLLNLHNPYALQLEGILRIEEAGSYTFVIQTHDGLADLYIDGKALGQGKEFGNVPESFNTKLDSGDHTFLIKYYYRHIQNQLSIVYGTAGMAGEAGTAGKAGIEAKGIELRAFEELVVPIVIK